MSFGDKCTQCGICCNSIPCGISLALLGDKQRCEALEKLENGQYQCGLVIKASKYLNIGENTGWKDDFLNKLFSHMLGVGAGCCSSPATEEHFYEVLELKKKWSIDNESKTSKEGAEKSR